MSKYVINNKINLISNESLTEPQFHIKRNALRYENNESFINYDPFLYPELLKRIFPNVDKIKILITLRKQSKLIYSLFVQHYKRFVTTELDSWDLYFKFLVRNLKQEFKIYNFYNLAKKYEKIFGRENIKFLLFEDFIKDKKVFLKELAKIMNLKLEIINSVYKEKHYRKREKNIEYSLRKAKTPNRLGNFILKNKDKIKSEIFQYIISKLYKELGRKK